MRSELSHTSIENERRKIPNLRSDVMAGVLTGGESAGNRNGVLEFKGKYQRTTIVEVSGQRWDEHNRWQA